jgi:hypothetical protein
LPISAGKEYVMQQFKIKRLAIDATNWTPFRVEQTASQINLYNESSTVTVAMRTTLADATTERTLTGSENFGFGSQQASFEPGETICWLQAASGTLTVVASYVR